MRELAIALLNDEHGINNTAWKIISDFLYELGSHDILDAVKCTEERYYLPENWS